MMSDRTYADYVYTLVMDALSESEADDHDDQLRFVIYKAVEIAERDLY